MTTIPQVNPGKSPASGGKPSTAPQPRFEGWLPDPVVIVQDKYGHQHKMPLSQAEKLYKGGSGGGGGDDEDWLTRALAWLRRHLK